MKTKTFILTTLMFVFLLIYPTGINAQTAKPTLDQVKLYQQYLGTWEREVGKDTVEVGEVQKYGKSFISYSYLVVKGIKSPSYINNICFDLKEGKLKGFILNTNGNYTTWIGLWTTEKKFSVDVVQDLKPGTVLGKVEYLIETPTSFIATRFNADGAKVYERKFKKVK